ncbi:MAG TPA: hypothetical protein VIL46_08060 [Gemmataceae bacterium]
MPYSAEISRTNPTCILFVIDQSGSMAKPFGGQQDRSKAEGVADAINRLLQNLVLKCAKSDGIRDYFHLGVIGYGGKVRPLMGGGGEVLVPVSTVANAPLRVEQRKRLVEDGAGGLVEQRTKFPVWFEPAAAGETPMCEALRAAREALAGFLLAYPDCYPPMVLHMTDGAPTDGNPLPEAQMLRRLSSGDGPVLLFNLHLSSRPAPPFVFPESEEGLPDKLARLLFRMSSTLPPRLQEIARAEGFPVGDDSRGFAFNADLLAVIRFLDIGTRVATQLR